MGANGRNDGGRFAKGNPGGPGRPRRTIEREYLAVLAETVTLDDWREVVAKAVAAAKQGNPRARAWLTQFLIGKEPPSLLSIAARDAAGLTAEREIEDAAQEHANLHIEMKAFFAELDKLPHHDKNGG